MENHPDKYYEIRKFNFSRRMVDHRIPYDFNFSINKPILTKPWLGSAKQRFLGSMMYYFGAYFSGGALVIAVTGAFLDAIWRQNRDSKDVKNSILFEPEPTYGERYVFNNKNKSTNLGKWNHNFSCFEGERFCGRDYNWIKKPKE